MICINSGGGGRDTDSCTVSTVRWWLPEIKLHISQHIPYPCQDTLVISESKTPMTLCQRPNQAPGVVSSLPLQRVRCTVRYNRPFPSRTSCARGIRNDANICDPLRADFRVLRLERCAGRAPRCCPVSGVLCVQRRRVVLKTRRRDPESDLETGYMSACHNGTFRICVEALLYIPVGVRYRVVGRVRTLDLRCERLQQARQKNFALNAQEISGDQRVFYKYACQRGHQGDVKIVLWVCACVGVWVYMKVHTVAST